MRYEDLVEMAQSAAVLWVTLRITGMESSAYYVSTVVDDTVRAAIEAREAMQHGEPEAPKITEA